MVENFKKIIKVNMIHNCPVTVEDITVAKDIWGKDISYLKGKTTRSRPTPVQYDSIKIPAELKSKHREVMLCMDTIYINKLPFLTTIGILLYYCTCTAIENGTGDKYYQALDKVLRVYNKKRLCN